MSNLRRLRRRFIIALIVMAVLDVAAVGLLVSPLAAAGAGQQEFDSVRRLVQAKMHIVIPPDQVQQRVKEASQQIDAFYRERLPARASQISEELGKVAAKTGVRLGQARYEELDSELPGLRHLRVGASLQGDYLAEVKFINALERDAMFFIVENVSLVEQRGGGVQLQVELETYLKEAE